jgi:hypothetical protein
MKRKAEKKYMSVTLRSLSMADNIQMGKVMKVMALQHSSAGSCAGAAPHLTPERPLKASQHSSAGSYAGAAPHLALERPPKAS